MANNNFDDLLDDAADAGMELKYSQPTTPRNKTAELVAQLYDSAEVQAIARVDLNFFARICMPDVIRVDFPPMYCLMWQLLTASIDRIALLPKIALGLPRGFAKTTFLKLFIAWLIAYTDLRFILIVGANGDLADNMLSDVMDILASENFTTLYGDYRFHLETDRIDLKKFVLRNRPIILASLGKQGKPRGFNIKNERPEFILMDDVQPKEEAASEILSKALLSWLTGTLMKTKSPRGCIYAWIGNMYAADGCILAKFQENPHWISLIAGCFLADGESLWPEVFSKEQLLAELAYDISIGEGETFFAEMMNDRKAGMKSGYDVTKIPPCPPDLADGVIAPQGAFYLIDPSLGKKTSDDVAIGKVEVYDGIPLLRKLWKDKYNPLETVDIPLQDAMESRTQLIIAESVAYQATLLFWMNWRATQLGISGINFCEISPGGYAKNARIKDMLKLLIDGKILLHPDVRAIVVHQIVRWDPLKNNNVDDVLDILAYITKAIEMYAPLMMLSNSLEHRDFEDAKVLPPSMCCSF